MEKPYIENWWGLMEGFISGTRTVFTFDTDDGEVSEHSYIYTTEGQN